MAERGDRRTGAAGSELRDQGVQLGRNPRAVESGKQGLQGVGLGGGAVGDGELLGKVRDGLEDATEVELGSSSSASRRGRRRRGAEAGREERPVGGDVVVDHPSIRGQQQEDVGGLVELLGVAAGAQREVGAVAALEQRLAGVDDGPALAATGGGRCERGQLGSGEDRQAIRVVGRDGQRVHEITVGVDGDEISVLVSIHHTHGGEIDDAIQTGEVALQRGEARGRSQLEPTDVSVEVNLAKCTGRGSHCLERKR